MIEALGYGGPEPLAIIFWYKEDEAYCKTVCYTEEEVNTMYKRHLTEGDMYNTFKPSIRLVKECLN